MSDDEVGSLCCEIVDRVDSDLYERTFNNFTELNEYLINLVKHERFAIKKRRSKTKNCLQTIYFACDRASVYENRLKLTDETRKRLCSSYLVDCPFMVVARERESGVWTLEPRSVEHNHDKADSMSAHPRWRCRGAKTNELVKSMIVAGSTIQYRILKY